MALPKIYRKRGDTGPSIKFTILQDGRPVSLAGATVYFQIRAPSATSLKVDSMCLLTNPNTYQYTYTPGPTDFDTAGEFKYEVKAILSNGQEYTIPSSGSGTLIITDDLE